MKNYDVTKKEVKFALHSIMRQMRKDKFKPDYIVGITRGGCVPAVMLSHYLDVPMNTLKVSLRDGDTDNESNLWMAEDAFNGTNILIVDDINDSGATLNWIKTDWPKGCFPDNIKKWNKIWHNNVKFATLYSKESSDFEVDYTGYEAEDEIWYTFPWEQWW